jgi:hypothetical protein
MWHALSFAHMIIEVIVVCRFSPLEHFAPQMVSLATHRTGLPLQALPRQIRTAPTQKRA